MSVRAKFRYTGYMATQQDRQVLDEKGVAQRYDPKGDGSHDGPYMVERVEVRTMTFVPVYGPESSHENRLFWQATPSGKLEMQVVNPEAWSRFEMGKCYYLDFTEAPD